MFEREGEDKSFLNNFVGILNALICEALPYENAHRAGLGKAELTAAPQVADMEDTVDMCEEICAVALPYGVAAYFSQDDGESGNAAMFRERFIYALQDAVKYRFSEIEDIYGGEEI